MMSGCIKRMATFKPILLANPLPYEISIQNFTFFFNFTRLCFCKGNIKLGRLIAPCTYTKVMFDPNNDEQIITKTFSISGRFPLREICEQITLDHINLGKFRSHLESVPWVVG